jgi:hypothetical protein
MIKEIITGKGICLEYLAMQGQNAEENSLFGSGT